MEAVMFLVIWVLCVWWASNITKKKGRGAGTGLVLGILLGIIGVAIAALLSAEPGSVASQAPSQLGAVTTGSPSPADELLRIADMRSKGVLTEDEFSAAKAKLLRS